MKMIITLYITITCLTGALLWEVCKIVNKKTEYAQAYFSCIDKIENLKRRHR